MFVDLITSRKKQEYGHLASITRAAQHADMKGFEDFMKSLEN